MKTEITGKTCPRVTVSTTIPYRLLHYWTTTLTALKWCNED
jgi:hypothetical protein